MIGNLHIPVEVSMDVLVSFSSSSGSEAVSSLLTELNEHSGIFLVIPIRLFIFESDRFTAFCRLLVVTKPD